MKGLQEEESVMNVKGSKKSPSLAITVWHPSASFVMAESDPRDGLSTPHTYNRSL